MLALALVALSAQGGSVVLSSSDIPVSVVQAGRDHLICSLRTNSVQQVVDVSNPSQPMLVGTPFDPPYGDQFADAVYTPQFGGRLVTAHRNGGINLIDASRLPALTSLHSQIRPPKHCHEGLDVFVGSNDTYVAYSEHNVSNTGGGLILYQMTAAALTPIGSFLRVGFDGNACAISADGSTVYQLGWDNNDITQGHLATYDTASWTGPPVLLSQVPIPLTQSYYSKDLQRSPVSTNMLAALGWDGLRAIDITAPRQPVVRTVIAAGTTFFLDGVVFFPGTSIAAAWGFIRVGTLDADFLALFDAGPPGFAIPLLAFDPGLRVDDVKIDTRRGRAYVVGRRRATGEAVLQVW